MRSLLLQREDYKEVSVGQSVHLCGVVCACMHTDLCSFVSIAGFRTLGSVRGRGASS